MPCTHFNEINIETYAFYPPWVHDPVDEVEMRDPEVGDEYGHCSIEERAL